VGVGIYMLLVYVELTYDGITDGKAIYKVEADYPKLGHEAGWKIQDVIECDPSDQNNAVYLFAERLRKQQGFDFQIFNVRETISYNTWGDIPTTITFEMGLEPYKSN